jgi:hypothetical protein
MLCQGATPRSCAKELCREKCQGTVPESCAKEVCQEAMPKGCSKELSQGAKPITVAVPKNSVKELCQGALPRICSKELWQRAALQRQNAENLKQIFSEKEYRGLSPNFHIHVSLSELYIPTMGLPVLLEEICGLIVGIYKSLKDTWMWKLGLRPRYSQKRNI